MVLSDGQSVAVGAKQDAAGGSFGNATGTVLRRSVERSGDALVCKGKAGTSAYSHSFEQDPQLFTQKEFYSLGLSDPGLGGFTYVWKSELMKKH